GCSACRSAQLFPAPADGPRSPVHGLDRVVGPGLAPEAGELRLLEALLTGAFLSALLAGALATVIPLLLAGLGEQLSEKAGVLNIGIEGMLLLGAYAGFLAAWASGSFWVGFLAGMAGGMALALPMIFLCVVLGLNQIVVGIALTLCAQGLTALLHHVHFSRTYPRLPKVEVLPLPLLSEIPVIGQALFSRHPVAYLAVLLVPLLIWLFRRTPSGRNLQPAGDRPDALNTSGVRGEAPRAWSILCTGAWVGLGGAYLASLGGGTCI